MNEYWAVKDKKTGRIIAQCGDINDAIMMVELDKPNRSYSRHRFLLDQVIDVTSTTDKQLSGQLGLVEGQVPILDVIQEKLPEGKLKPVIV